MGTEQDILLEMKNVRKVFPGVIAVNDVSFKIKKGEVHIVIGENGAGKSTLVKMMAGLLELDDGQMLFEGADFRPGNVLDAQHEGVNIIHQELSLMPNRTVAQNIFVGREHTRSPFKIIDSRRMSEECRKLLDKLEIDIDPKTMVKDLSIAQQQMVEVSKAVSTKNKLLIMDEPTSSLTQKEIDNLFRITRKMKSEGVSVIYISHRMQELMEIGDRITVMRDGCYIGTREADEVSMQELITMMVGRKIENIYSRTYNTPGYEVARTENLTGLRFRNININIKEKEIVGIAGLVGAGRTELAKSLYGFDPVTGGDIYFEGQKINISGYCSYDAVDMSMSLLPENRKTEGLFIDMSIKDNIVQSSWRTLFKKGFVNNKIIGNAAQKGVEDLRIATTSIDKRVYELSGGNQQKVVIAKWLTHRSKLFIFDEPTRGIDIGAKSEIYHLMNKLAEEGAGILMISSDLPELLGIADRIYVMKDGEIQGEVNKDQSEFNQEYILNLAIRGVVGDE